MSTLVNHYPNEAARKNRQPAGAFGATRWTDAPGSGNWWAMPDGLPRLSTTMIVATTRNGESFYVGTLPKGITYA
jgi:hypothetical protein